MDKEEEWVEIDIDEGDDKTIIYGDDSLDDPTSDSDGDTKEWKLIWWSHDSWESGILEKKM